ncbi:MAG: hypothetical protein J6Y94_03960 [Bacteriovoracaceae bacterium]|nr:hypothetical protein [Bacteriovoracaceae bacterium]
MYFLKHIFSLSLLLAVGGLLGFRAEAAENPCPKYLMVLKWVPLPEATQKIIKQAVAAAEKVADENFAYQIYAGIKDLAAENPAIKVGWEGPGGDVFLPSPRAMVVIYRPNSVVDYYYMEPSKKAGAFSLNHWQVVGKAWPKVVREEAFWEEGMPQLFSYMLQGDFGTPPELNPQRDFFLAEPSLALLRERVRQWASFLKKKYDFRDYYEQEKERYTIYLDRHDPGRSIWRVEIVREADGRIKNYELYKYLAIVLPGGMEDSISFPMQRFSSMAEVTLAVANDIGNTLELPLDGEQLRAADVDQTFSKLADLLAMQKLAPWRAKPLDLGRIQSLGPGVSLVSEEQYFNDAQKALYEIYPSASSRNKHWAAILQKYSERGKGPHFFTEYAKQHSWHNASGNASFALEINLPDGESEIYFVEDYGRDNQPPDSGVWKLTTKFGGVPFEITPYNDWQDPKNFEVIRASGKYPLYNHVRIDNLVLHLAQQVHKKARIVDLKVGPHYLANLEFPSFKYTGFAEIPAALKKVVEDYCTKNNILYELVEESIRHGEYWRYAFRLHDGVNNYSFFEQEVTISSKLNAEGKPFYQLARKILIPHRSAELSLPEELRLPPYETAAFDELWLKVSSMLAGYARAVDAEHLANLRTSNGWGG